MTLQSSPELDFGTMELSSYLVSPKQFCWFCSEGNLGHLDAHSSILQDASVCPGGGSQPSVQLPAAPTALAEML